MICTLRGGPYSAAAECGAHAAATSKNARRGMLPVAPCAVARVSAPPRPEMERGAGVTYR